MSPLAVETSILGSRTLLAMGGPPLGVVAFAGVFALVLIWLVMMPGRLIGESAAARAPWWRNVRFWAIVVAVVQIGVYVCWG